MKILSFETSCDDTSIALFEDDKLISMHTESQIKIHNLTGGVVPEVAAREHANVIFGVIDKVLDDARVKIEEIDYIGVTTNPGLIPSLLTGITVARTFSKVLNIPLLEINHIQAHIFSNFLERKQEEINFPLVCLTVSGGHNDIYYMEDMWSMEKIGTSGDDAAGESFDKVAKMMGLPYPGGPVISKLALEYKQENKNLFPRVWLKKDEYDFSFSGLKSAVKREIDKKIKANVELVKTDEELKLLQEQNKKLLKESEIKEISYEFQNSVTEVLAYKLVNAGIKKEVKTLMLAGGVSSNDNLKNKIKNLSEKNNLEFIYPKKKLYCMDNAAMVGILTYYKIKFGK